jgi:hypothetical protein
VLTRIIAIALVAGLRRRGLAGKIWLGLAIALGNARHGTRREKGFDRANLRPAAAESKTPLILRGADVFMNERPGRRWCGKPGLDRCNAVKGGAT